MAKMCQSLNQPHRLVWALGLGMYLGNAKPKDGNSSSR